MLRFKKFSTVLFLSALALFATGCGQVQTEAGLTEVRSVNTISKDELANAVKKAEPSETTTESTETSVSADKGVTVTFIGDVTLTQNYLNINDACFDKVVGDDLDYCFKNCKEIFEKDDLTLANLEGSVSERKTHAQKQFNFQMKPESMKMLTNASIEAVNIANNHTRDFLVEGLTETKDNLDKYKIIWSNQEKGAIYEVKGVKIGMFGITENSGLQTAYARIDELKEGGADIIIASCHWGIEAKYTITASQETIGHSLIDHGVDIVIGTHPHRLQKIEEYGGKYILYSLSNFCFGGNARLSDPDTAIIQCTFNMDDSGHKCLGYDLNVIPYNQTSSPGNDYCPVMYEWGTEDYFRVLKRLEWSREDE